MHKYVAIKPGCTYLYGHQLHKSSALINPRQGEQKVAMLCTNTIVPEIIKNGRYSELIDCIINIPYICNRCNMPNTQKQKQKQCAGWLTSIKAITYKLPCNYN